MVRVVLYVLFLINIGYAAKIEDIVERKVLIEELTEQLVEANRAVSLEMPKPLQNRILKCSNIHEMHALDLESKEWLSIAVGKFINMPDMVPKFDLVIFRKNYDHLVIAEIVFLSIWFEIHQKPYALDELLKKYGYYWSNKDRPSYYVSPNGRNFIKWCWQSENIAFNSGGIAHIGIDRVNHQFLCYEWGIGVYYPSASQLLWIRDNIISKPDVYQFYENVLDQEKEDSKPDMKVQREELFRGMHKELARVSVSKMGVMPAGVKAEILQCLNVNDMLLMSPASLKWVQNAYISTFSPTLSYYQWRLSPLLRSGDDWGSLYRQMVWCNVHNKPFSLGREVSYYASYWKSLDKPILNIDPLSYGKIDWKWLLRESSADRVTRVIHIGIDQTSQRFVCYDLEVGGLYYPEGELLERIRIGFVQGKLLDPFK